MLITYRLLNGDVYQLEFDENTPIFELQTKLAHLLSPAGTFAEQIDLVFGTVSYPNIDIDEQQPVSSLPWLLVDAAYELQCVVNPGPERLFLQAIRERRFKYDALRNASEEVLNSKRVALAVIRQGYGLQFFSAELCADQPFILKAVRQNGNAIQFASEALREDRELVEIAVNNNAEAIQFASEALRGDWELVLMAARQYSDTIQYVSAELRTNQRFVGKLKDIERISSRDLYRSNFGFFTSYSDQLTIQGLSGLFVGVLIYLYIGSAPWLPLIASLFCLLLCFVAYQFDSRDDNNAWFGLIDLNMWLFYFSLCFAPGAWVHGSWIWVAIIAYYGVLSLVGGSYYVRQRKLTEDVLVLISSLVNGHIIKSTKQGAEIGAEVARSIVRLFSALLLNAITLSFIVIFVSMILLIMGLLLQLAILAGAISVPGYLGFSHVPIYLFMSHTLLPYILPLTVVAVLLVIVVHAIVRRYGQQANWADFLSTPLKPIFIFLFATVNRVLATISKVVQLPFHLLNQSPDKIQGVCTDEPVATGSLITTLAGGVGLAAIYCSLLSSVAVPALWCLSLGLIVSGSTVFLGSSIDCLARQYGFFRPWSGLGAVFSRPDSRDKNLPLPPSALHT